MSPTVSESTLSPAPFSPFSTYSVTSGATSDDAPDLGAFTTVFRALNTFHHPRGANGNALHLSDSGESARTPTSTFLLSDYESEAQADTTVWNQRTIADYLDETDDDRENQLDDDQPSLGLAGALDFLAAERAKYLAQLDAAGPSRGHSSSQTADDTWRHTLQPRRKRRRKRTRSQSVSARRSLAGDGATETGGEADMTNEEDMDNEDTTDSSEPREPAHYYESVPATPPQIAARVDRRHQKENEREGRLAVHHTRSTPSLRLPVIMPIDPRVLQLRNLAHKLRMLFPKDAASLAAILSDDQPNANDFVDPRGPTPRARDTLVHVFIDHSNILIGFIMYLRRHLTRMHRKAKQMSYAALALILERGRPVTRRVMATSSPLYQPVDPAEQLGYEVHVLQRVPDAGDGTYASNSNSSGPDNSTQSPVKSRKSQGQPVGRGHTRGGSLGHNTAGPSYTRNGTSPVSDSNVNGSSTNGRRRFREQGVDELLQLKLHQALASADEVPPNSTIILATGDGNVGQFNEEGFLGCVKLALKKGWRVELYAWEGGLSKMWKREFGTNPRFEIYMLDRFAVDLLEL